MNTSVDAIKTIIHKPPLPVEKWSGLRDTSAAFCSHKLEVLVKEIVKKMAFENAWFTPEVSETQLRHRIHGQKFNGSFTAL